MRQKMRKIDTEGSVGLKYLTVRFLLWGHTLNQFTPVTVRLINGVITFLSFGFRNDLKIEF